MNYFSISNTTWIKRSFLLVAVLLPSKMTFSQSYRDIHIGLVYPISSAGISATEQINGFSIHAFSGVSGGEKVAAISGFTNVIRGKAQGVQLAGFSNHTKDSTAGVQVAGFINTSRSVLGVQLSGFSNVAKNVKGVQIGGFVNIARRVIGTQVSGFVNIADSSDYPVGLVNIIKNGEKNVGVSVDETQTTVLGVRTGGRVLYGVVGLGYNWKNEKAVYAVEAGFGAHVKINGAVRVNSEIISTILQDFKDLSYYRASIRLMPALKVMPGVELFAGPSINFVQTRSDEGKKMVKDYLWERSKSARLQGMYLGGVLGLQVKF